MKYEAEIDLRNANTSHALMVELVGCEQRVLDVGCAAGDLGRVLKRRGCRVAGVELDPVAAEAAEVVLDELLVGDVNNLDLVRHFGKQSFDVVVFGDVLEHLADPVSVLKRVRPLLTETGSVVASIPNVAHGSVRLALLNGCFDYRQLGLLDSTHLRFFTRGSVHEVFREAGFVPVDMRRTTAGVFDTEIDIRRSDFDEGVVDAVEGDPDSTTYQFVLRAVPEDSPGAIGSDAPPATPARREARVRVGIWTDARPDDLGGALVARITRAEIARRLPGAAIRSFSSRPDFRPSPHDGGVPVEPLGPWSMTRAEQLAAELDCAVVAGELRGEDEARRDPIRFLFEGLAAAQDVDCPVLWSGVRLPADPPPALVAGPAYSAVMDDSEGHWHEQATDEPSSTVPDPLLLVPRLLSAEAAARRLEFVRMMGWFPPHGRALVVEVHAALLPHTAALASALDAAIAGTDAAVVLFQMDRQGPDGARAADEVSAAMATPAFRVPDDSLADDLVAVMANGAALGLCSPSALALGLAYGRPIAYLAMGGRPSSLELALRTEHPAAVIGQAGEMAQLLDEGRFPPTEALAGPLQARLDAHFDRVVAIADAAAAARPRMHDSRPVLSPADYVGAMELAHRRMQQRLDAERFAVADHLGVLRQRHEDELRRAMVDVEALLAERQRLEARLHELLAETTSRAEQDALLRRELEHVTGELEALRGTRVLRLLRPARMVYARVRGHRL